MLTSYVDDSGSSQDPVFVLAGYVAPVAVWGSFSASWEDALATPPSLPYLKANHAHRLKDSFLGWSEKKRDAKLAALAEVIGTQPIISGIVFALPWEEFRRARAEHPEIADFQPYDLLFHQVMSQTTDALAKSGAGETIEYVFDEQGTAGERAILTYRAIRDILPKRQTGLIVGTPRMADDKLVLPLQAADLLAWNVRRYFAKHRAFPYKEGERFPIPGHPILTRLLDHQFLYGQFDYAGVKTVLEAWSKPRSEVFGDDE